MSDSATANAFAEQHAAYDAYRQAGRIGKLTHFPLRVELRNISVGVQRKAMNADTSFPGEHGSFVFNAKA